MELKAGSLYVRQTCGALPVSQAESPATHMSHNFKLVRATVDGVNKSVNFFLAPESSGNML